MRSLNVVSRSAAMPRRQYQPVVLLQTRLPVDLRAALEQRAATDGVSLARVTQAALRAYLAGPEPEAPKHGAEAEEDNAPQRADPASSYSVREPE